MEEASELEYLTWFRLKAYFGPSHDDAIYYLDEEFEQETGKKVPDNWKVDED